jgi:stage III sporulation protein SpoIIIAA
MTDLELLLQLLPLKLRKLVDNTLDVTEFILDLGRPFEIRYGQQTIVHDSYIITRKEIDFAEAKLGPFGQDNRAGIDETLHRISKIVTRSGETVGLTCRCGRSIEGSIDGLKDFLDRGLSVLLLGAPGVGKTTRLREVARYLSQTRRVVIVDTSNEIAGEGRIPHPAVGRSRRLQVPYDKSQHDVMIEAVENHTPETIIIDEISTIPEADASRTISQRGVQLVATAHGKTLSDFVNNPPLKELVGGINVVTLSDDRAMVENDGKKTLLERKTDPSFDVVVEIVDYSTIRVHPSTVDAVDAILRGGEARPEEWRELGGVTKKVYEAKVSLPMPAPAPPQPSIRERFSKETGRQKRR